MKKPFDLSMRDYIKLTQKQSEKFFLGTPVFGSTSKKWMIPGGVGIKLNEKYLGTMTIGFEIKILAEMLGNSIKNCNVKFTLIDLQNTPILYANNNHHENCTEKNCHLDKKTIQILNELKHDHKNSKSFISTSKNDAKAIFVKNLEKYPYILLLEYDKKVLRDELLKEYKAKIKIITIFAILFLSLILSYRLVFI